MGQGLRGEGISKHAKPGYRRAGELTSSAQTSVRSKLEPLLLRGCLVLGWAPGQDPGETAAREGGSCCAQAGRAAARLETSGPPTAPQAWSGNWGQVEPKGENWGGLWSSPSCERGRGAGQGQAGLTQVRKASSLRRPALYSPRPCGERLHGLSESGSTPVSPCFKAGQVVTMSELQFPHSLSSQEC